MKIVVDNLTNASVIALLEQHLSNMYAQTPAESVHALDITELRHPLLTCWSVRDGQQIMGFGALKEIDSKRGEIKSMCTAAEYQRKGVASSLLTHIMETGRGRGYETLLLETGSMEFFKAARLLYEHHGFTPCPPFGDYQQDPNSTYYQYRY